MSPESRRPDENAEEDEYEEEVSYVTLDFGSNPLSIDQIKEYQLIGLDSKTPVIRLGQNIYRGTWNELLGTEIILEKAGDTSRVVGLSKDRLLMEQVQLKPKEQPIPEQASAPQPVPSTSSVQEHAMASTAVGYLQNAATNGGGTYGGEGQDVMDTT
ncbi:hypothetical protein SAICODRAFT_72566 [Saitoella complicata NRRL Y-17804]|uniref:Transcription factor TFIIIC triple barrel domain-containing protein n=1 Tax=Saitoella complicata (strain BCRC 22490 / CBS 7301 / JCM 7358 / NBRC 10748 / NRRL Y-17804) TaxID=698492 RepID=A0A0E9NC55_SAICN|nr:uncharacterized protein SAICODRAFT_72566 [Saitoella complicata NRRL Y-17804]ODQ51623.1 hypothetical protein SAICODRAFT_72566 [Saitoella complicata NRRL Y-17804]GAO47373.1 hypothetical protein G7K_1581-t1 [Saitoella complicata NRRL Y-17804]